MPEIWKSLVGYEGRYEISNQGRLKSLTDQFGRPREMIGSTKPRADGYVSYELNWKGKSKNIYAHRLVALHFIENPENKPFVNHIDSIRNNNYVENLEWCTQSENTQHGYTYGNMKPVRHRLGKRTGKSKYSHTYFEKSRNRWVACVEHLNQEGSKAPRQSFACKKHGMENAEKLAALAVNTILDSIGDTERPRNKVEPLNYETK